MKDLRDYTSHKVLDDSREGPIEDIIFSVLVAVFIAGLLLYSGGGPTAMVASADYSGSTWDTINIGKIYDSNAEIPLTLKGMPTSIRVSGRFIGEGSARIYLGDMLIVESEQLPIASKGMLTGLVIEDIPQEEPGDISGNENEYANNSIPVNETDGIFVDRMGEQEALPENSSSADAFFGDIDVEEDKNESVSPEGLLQDDALLDSGEEIEMQQNASADNLTIQNDANASAVFENVSLNASQNISEIPEPSTDMFNLSANDSALSPGETQDLTNISLNETGILPDITLNETDLMPDIYLNDSMNETFNETFEVTNATIGAFIIRDFENYCQETCYMSDIAQDITLRIELDGIILNLTSITYTYSGEGELIEEPPQIPQFTNEDILRASLQEEGLVLLDIKEGEINELAIGIDERNYLIFSTPDINRHELAFFEPKDERLTSKIILTNISKGEIVLESSSADLVLRCLQFEEGICKKWKKTNIKPIISGGSASFSISLPGAYGLTKSRTEKKELLPTNSVYYNSNCDRNKCEQPYQCEAENFCVIQNKLKDGLDFTGQLDFDILNINEVKSAEICAYVTYNDIKGVFNYLKYSPEGFCANIDYRDTASDMISYRVVKELDEWICLDATEIVQYAYNEGHSNLFVNWFGQDVQGNAFPITCYAGISELENCGGSNPSGAGDCRPYMKIKYK